MSNSTPHMLPFTLRLRTGVPVHQQVVYAATRAVVTGQLQPGERFPSVRQLSQELGINPNTAHKAVAALIRDGHLESVPGIGTVVAKAAEAPPGLAGQKDGLLGEPIEHLVVEAKRLSISLEELVQALSHHWQQLDAEAGATDRERRRKD